MTSRGVRIRTLEDFVTVPSAELTGCLVAFKSHVDRVKTYRADAVRAGRGNLVPLEFVWRPKVKPSVPVAYPAATPIAELQLRPSAVRRLREMQIYCLEDCGEASQGELMPTQDIGPSTLLRLRELLNAVGLDFKESAHPVTAAYDRARLLRKEPLTLRAGRITDASDIAELGLKTTTFTTCMKHKILTVGDLRRLNFRGFLNNFGSGGKRDIAHALRTAGLTLEGNPSDLELWRNGMLDRDQMSFPGDHQAIMELRPWIGACVEPFDAAGLATVLDLRNAVKAGKGRVLGVGQSTLERVITVLRQHG